jgi:ABC-type glycerol-3-phosphate transport system substrate-binding protein
MTRSRFHLLAPALAVVALVVAACGGSDSGTTSSASSGAAPAATTAAAGSTAAAAPDANVSGSISMAGVWTGDEQKNFQAVLDGFKKQFPNVTVKYNPAGDQLPTVLATAVAGGKPPDMAAVAQPGLMRDFQKQGKLKPIDYAKDAIAANFGQSWIDLGTVDSHLYGLTFKAANKSTVWYNVPAFTDAGVQPPKTFDELLTAAGTLQSSGLPAYSLGGADGWTLTDLFENIYLRQAGPDMYDKLSTHAIPWTDQTVKDALTSMAKVVGDTPNVVGGASGALETDFPTSVTKVFSDPPKAAMVFEGDFVGGVITSSTKAQPKTGFDVFGFPSINDSPASVVGGGDTVITFNDTPAVQALVSYLTTPEAASIWAAKGGFSSANKGVDPSVYPDDITRATATALADAETFRFDMSDLAPAAFGGTVGQGEWKDMQDFVKSPTDVDGTATQLEADAAKAFGS